MSNASFVQIYTEVFTDPLINGLPPSYKCVLYTILAHACFAPCKMNDHGQLIHLEAGQFMCTVRHLAELANVGKNDAERALKKFVEFKIVRQEVRHKKTVITVLWGIKTQNEETTKETRKRQTRDTKEEDIEDIDITTPPQTPQKKQDKEAGGEDKKKIKFMIKSCLEKALPFSEAGIYSAFKQTSGFAVQQALIKYQKRNPNLQPLKVPDLWLRSQAIKEYEAHEELKDYD